MAVKRLQLWTLISVCVAITVLGLLGILVIASGRTASAALGPTTLSGVPNVINYQGMLRQPDGTPINGTYTMTFRLYDDPIAASALYTETLQNVMVREGLFTVLLGDVDPIDTALFKLPLYVGIQVENDVEMAPRQRLAPVPYAVQLTDGIYVSGDGNVGVGNTDPLTDTTLLVGPATGGRHLTLNDMPTARWGFATGWWDLSVQSDFGGSWAERVRFTENGDIRAAGGVRGTQTYQVFWADADPYDSDRALGQWDLCTILSYEVSGVDDARDDWGVCKITFDSNVLVWWADVGPLSFLADDPRPQWHLYARANDQVNSVKCEAICLKFE